MFAVPSTLPKILTQYYSSSFPKGIFKVELYELLIIVFVDSNVLSYNIITFFLSRVKSLLLKKMQIHMKHIS